MFKIKRKQSMLPTMFFLIVIVFSSSVFALTFKQWDNADLRHPVRVEGAVDPTVVVNITVYNPDNEVLVNFEPMTYNPTSQEHNYTVKAADTGILGTYDYTITASDGNNDVTIDFSFEVTPSGDNGMGNYYYLIIILSYGVLILGFYKEDITITMLGTFALYFVGIWMLFFGIDVFKNYLTNGFAIITLGIAMYVSSRMAHEYITI